VYNIANSSTSVIYSDNKNINNSLFIKEIRELINRGNLDSTLNIIDRSDYNSDIIKDILRAEVFEAASQYNTAAIYYKKAYVEMSDKTDSLAWSTLLNIIIANDKSSNHTENRELISEANRIISDSYNAKKKADLLNIEAIIYNKLRLTGKAHNYIDSAIYINNKLNEFDKLSINYTTKANIFFRNRDFNSALKFFRKAYKTNLNKKPRRRIAKNLTNIAAALHMRGMLIESMDMYNKILFTNIRHEISPKAKATVYYNASNLYHDLNKADSSIIYLDSAINLSESIRDFYMLRTAYEQKAKLNYFAKSFKKAYKYSRIANMYNDSLNTKQLIKAVTNVDLNNSFYISEQRELDAKVAKINRDSLIRTFIIIIAVIVVIAATVILLLIKQRRRKDSMFCKSVKSLKKKHSDYLNIHSEINRIKEINRSLKKDMSRAVFIIQENIELYGKVDKVLNNELHMQNKVKDISSSVSNMQTMMKESDFISGNASNEDVDLRIRIKQEFPELTKNEIRLCILIRLELSTKEIVCYTNTAAGSVEVAKYRLRKKLGFDTLGEMQKKLMII
jgi:Uri superfamily endonuclease